MIVEDDKSFADYLLSMAHEHGFKGLVTSRKPDDIPAFNREMIFLFGGETGSSRSETA